MTTEITPPAGESKKEIEEAERMALLAKTLMEVAGPLIVQIQGRYEDGREAQRQHDFRVADLGAKERGRALKLSVWVLYLVPLLIGAIAIIGQMNDHWEIATPAITGLLGWLVGMRQRDG